MRSNQKRKMPESPMGCSKCPKCKAPFSESHDGPLPGQKTYTHSNGDSHVESTPSAADTDRSPVPPQPAQEKSAPFSGASGSNVKLPKSLIRQLRGGRR